jgi:hypothetical protein
MDMFIKKDRTPSTLVKQVKSLARGTRRESTFYCVGLSVPQKSRLFHQELHQVGDAQRPGQQKLGLRAQGGRKEPQRLVFTPVCYLKETGAVRMTKLLALDFWILFGGEPMGLCHCSF